MQCIAICDVDQRNDLIGMIKVGKETHVFPFFTSAYEGQKLMKTMLGAEEASYHIPCLVCRSEHKKGSGNSMHILSSSIPFSSAEKDLPHGS